MNKKDNSSLSNNKRQSMIKIRGGFSERNNIYKCNAEMQIKELDDRTRTLINNMIFDILVLFFEGNKFHYKKEYSDGSDGSNAFCKDILANVFLQKTVLQRGHSFDWRFVYENYIYDVIENAPYNEVFDILWYICDWIINNYKSEFYNEYPNEAYEMLNSLFEKEYVGYRFIDGEIVPITDEIEVNEIEASLSIAYQGTKSHINKALHYLSDRDNPDYKNSIKESISAVESICKIITNDENATLGKALRILESKNGLKGQLKSGFEKLYNYTNDKGGIRHAEGLFESEVSFEEAKYMLISCCAFVNYLLAEYGK